MFHVDRNVAYATSAPAHMPFSVELFSFGCHLNPIRDGHLRLIGTSLRAEATHFRFSPDSGHIAALHHWATRQLACDETRRLAANARLQEQLAAQHPLNDLKTASRRATQGFGTPDS
jgi:hypothetical protein